MSAKDKKAQKEDSFFRGKQIVFLIYDDFWVTDAHDAVFDCANLFTINFRHFRFRKFDRKRTRFRCRWPILTWWRHAMFGQIESMWVWSNQNRIGIVSHGIHQQIFLKKKMVKRWEDQKLRVRNYDARNGRIESGAVVKNRKRFIGVERGKSICYQWMEKGQCLQGDRCSFRHETQDRAQKPEHTAATLSESTVSRGRSVSRKRSIRGKCNHGSILRQPCRYYLKGTCTRTPCEYWHPPKCHFFESETSCKAGDTCPLPHYKFDEQPDKKPKKSNISKRRESNDRDAESWNRNSDWETLTPEMRELKEEQLLRVAGDSRVERGHENAINREQKDSVREERSVVSGTMNISVQNRHQKPLHPLNHQHKKKKCVEEKEPQKPECIWEVRSTAVQKRHERYLQQITLWLLAPSQMSSL